MDFLDLNAAKKKEESLGVGIDDEKISSADDFYSGDISFSTPSASSDKTSTYQNTYSDTYETTYSTSSTLAGRPASNQNTYGGSSVSNQNTYDTGMSSAPTYQSTYNTDMSSSSYQNTYSNVNNAGTYGSNIQNNIHNTGAMDSAFYRDSASTELHVLGELEKISKAIEVAEWILIIGGVLLAIVSFAGSLSGIAGAFVAIFNFIDICICMGLAFGISKKNKVCAILAIIYGGLGVLTSLLSFRRLFAKIAILGAYITAYQKISRFHQLKSRYEFDSDDRIASYFRKEPASFKIRHLVMIIALILGLIGGIYGISKVVSDVGGAVSSVVETRDMDNWKRVNIGEGEGISVLMPTEPRITTSGSETTYVSDGFTSYIIVRHADGIAQGLTEKQREAVAENLFSNIGYEELYSQIGEDSNGHYVYKVLRVEEEGIIMCAKVMILEEDMVFVSYSVMGDEYSDEIKETAEEYFSKIYRTY